MTVTILSALIVVGFSLVIVVLVFARRRAMRPAGPAAGSMVSYTTDGQNVFGIRPGELDDFRQSARDQLYTQREQWDRDYHPESARGLPGRVAGIPRTLRVR